MDLAGEFERQYYGDVMLFAMEQLCAAGYPSTVPARARIAATVAATEASLRARYRARQARIADQVDALERFLEADGRWWHAWPGLGAALADFRRFVANMRRNFAQDAPAWRLIESDDHRGARLAAIVAAIDAYPGDRLVWRAALRP